MASSRSKSPRPSIQLNHLGARFEILSRADPQSLWGCHAVLCDLMGCRQPSTENIRFGRKKNEISPSSHVRMSTYVTRHGCVTHAFSRLPIPGPFHYFHACCMFSRTPPAAAGSRSAASPCPLHRPAQRRAAAQEPMRFRHRNNSRACILSVNEGAFMMCKYRFLDRPVYRRIEYHIKCTNSGGNYTLTKGM